MESQLRGYRPQDIPALRALWNAVVEEGNAFPQTEPMSLSEAERFFAQQDHVGVLEEEGNILGLYILHPNNVGRCGHIANASFAVQSGCRGRKVGERLVRDCIRQGGRLGFRILQFNAVVCTNAAAIHLYEKIGFRQLGSIPGGFRLPDGSYTDIFLYYIPLPQSDGE